MDIWKSKGKCDPARLVDLLDIIALINSRVKIPYEIPSYRNDSLPHRVWNFTSQWLRSIQNNNSPPLLVNSLRLLDGGAFFYLSALVEWTEDRLLNVQAKDIFVLDLAGMIQSVLDSLHVILADSAA
ncbi:hypothetical protein M422DRAFT_33525, partial [Sphaerobolus stellatus SS14]